MSRKRTSLDAILNEPAPVPAEPPAAPVAAARPFKQQTIYLPMPVYEQLRRLAFEERVKMHGLLMEGLDRVFRDRGLAGIEDLKSRAV
jgi:hypothetical protein